MQETFIEIYHSTTRALLFNAFFVFLIVSIVSIFKKMVINDNLLKLFSFLLIFIGLINLTLLFLNYQSYSERLNGKYGLIAIIMILGNCFSALLLLIPRVRIKIFSFLIVLFLMQIGRFFELFVILITTLHRDYLP